jgi:hypothetical protein
MKKKKFNELIQKPLRFHHQDIHEELEAIKGMLRDVNNQMQKLRESIRGAPVTTQMLPVFQPYQHPWWQYQWTGPDPSRNNLGGQVQASRFRFDETGSTVSGATKTA